MRENQHALTPLMVAIWTSRRGFFKGGPPSPLPDPPYVFIGARNPQ